MTSQDRGWNDLDRPRFVGREFHGAIFPAEYAPEESDEHRTFFRFSARKFTRFVRRTRRRVWIFLAKGVRSAKKSWPPFKRGAKRWARAIWNIARATGKWMLGKTRRVGSSILGRWKKWRGKKKDAEGSPNLPNRDWGFSSLFLFTTSIFFVLYLLYLVFSLASSETALATVKWIAIVAVVIALVSGAIWTTKKYGDGGVASKNPSQNSYLYKKMTGGLVGFAIWHLVFLTFWPEMWGQWFSDIRFFVGTNLAILTIVLFPSLFGNEETKRKADMGKSWGLVIAITLAFGLYGRIKNPPTEETLIATNTLWMGVEGPDKDAVIKAFPGDTVMWNIAAVESGFRQYSPDDSTKPMQNAEGSSAFGVFQIMESLHGRDCGVDGVDIYTLEGNLACARKLLKNNPDYSDWFDSAGKWRGYPVGQPGTILATSSQDDEGEEFVVTVPRGGESEVVEVPYGYKLSRFVAETSDSFTFISPSRKVYRMEAGKKNPPVGYEVGSWKFAIDSAIADLRIHVTRVRVEER